MIGQSSRNYAMSFLVFLLHFGEHFGVGFYLSSLGLSYDESVSVRTFYIKLSDRVNVVLPYGGLKNS